MRRPRAKRGRGRPTKLTPEVIEKVASVVRVGNYLDTAARYCGIDKVTFHSWMKKGHAQKHGIFRDFLNAMETAQAAADVRDHAFIAQASAKHWQAAVEHLRLRNQARYSKQRHEITGPGGQPIGVAVMGAEEAIRYMTREQVLQIANMPEESWSDPSEESEPPSE